MNNFKDKSLKLCSFMEQLTKKNIAVAFSGGADSSLLLKLACEAAAKNNTMVYAITMQTKLHPCSELEYAKKTADEMGAKHIQLPADELEKAGIMDNPPDRCYRCKKYLFQRIVRKAADIGISTIIEGTNEDDMHTYRPGIQAVQELGIISPLADCGFSKEEVRRLAAEYRISASERPSMPCLATRFPYGAALDYEMLRKVETGEAYLKTLGIYNIRLRVHGDMARIEVDEQDMEKILENKKDVTAYLKNLGYAYISLDLEGFRSGSMDEVRSDK